jgi:hypothetical protein
MTRPFTPLLLGAAALWLISFASPTTADNTTKEQAQTQKASQSKKDTHPRWSNWPNLPERQGGRSYSKLVRPEFGGPVERNFESGRN